MHVNYATVPMYEDTKIDTGGKKLTDADYRVEKMKYGKNGKEKDLTTLHYNNHITVTGIPLEACLRLRGQTASQPWTGWWSASA